MSVSLSQDEIDVLLKERTEADPSGDADSSADAPAADGSADGPGREAPDVARPADPLSGEESDVLRELGDICMASAATALAELLGHPVSIAASRVRTTDEATLRAEQPRPTVIVKIDFADGLVGRNTLMVSIKDASVIADLMTGGPGESSDELGEIHTSAVAEAMNQMMGAAAKAMAELVGRRVSISAPVVDVVDLSDDGAALEATLREDSLVAVSFSMTVGDLISTEIMQLMPAGFARELLAGGLAPPAPEPAPPVTATAPVDAAEGAAYGDPVADDPIEGSPREIEAPLPDVPAQPAGGAPEAQPVAFPPLEPANAAGAAGDISLLLDVPLHVSVELGRTELRIRNVLDLVPGSIIELDRLAGEPVDVLVNGKNIARGEVVVIDEEFGVRITEVSSPAARLNGLTP